MALSDHEKEMTDPMEWLNLASDVEDKFYSVQETADILGVSKATVFRMCRSGKIGHTRIGEGQGMIRIPRADLVEYAMRRYRAAWNIEG